MIVQKASDADIDILADLRIEYLKEDSGFLDESDAEVIAKSLPDYFARHLGRDLYCYIIRDGNDIAACAFLLIVEKPMSPAFINGKTGTVLNVYTRPSCRHRGYAREIMEELIADAKKMELSRIELKSTEAGHSLYLSMGFKDDDSHYHLMNRSDIR